MQRARLCGLGEKNYEQSSSENEVKKKYSVAYVIRPRTKESNACLRFTLLSGVPDKKSWKRDPDMSDPSRSVKGTEWKMDSTVE